MLGKGDKKIGALDIIRNVVENLDESDFKGSKIKAKDIKKYKDSAIDGLDKLDKALDKKKKHK